MFNSNRKGIVLKCSKFHKSCHLTNINETRHLVHQVLLHLHRCHFLLHGPWSSDVQGYTNRHDAILRARPFAFYERPAEAVPESSWIDRRKMYTKNTRILFRSIRNLRKLKKLKHFTKFQTNDLGQRASSLVTSRFSNWLSVSFFLCFWASWLGDSSSRGWMNRTDGMVGLWRHADTVDCWCTVETLTF